MIYVYYSKAIRILVQVIIYIFSGMENTIIVLSKKPQLEQDTLTNIKYHYLHVRWHQEWVKQSELARTVLATRFGYVQMDKLTSVSTMFTLQNRYKSSTIKNRFGDLLKIWQFERYPEGTTVSDLVDMKDVLQYVNVNQSECEQCGNGNEGSDENEHFFYLKKKKYIYI